MLSRWGVKYVKTPKDSPAGVDAVLMKGDCLVGVSEMKCRQMTTEQLMGEYRGEWLVTYSKLEKLSSAARLLGVPGVGLLYLVPEKKLLSVRICNEDGLFIPGIRVERTATQATVNGGTAVRENAYVSVADAKVV